MEREVWRGWKGGAARLSSSLSHFLNTLIAAVAVAMLAALSGVVAIWQRATLI
jgi:hypothetical protein